MKKFNPLNHYILGFTNDYYTLWHLVMHTGRGTCNVNYYKNISMDHDTAVAYMNEHHGENWVEDLSQRGDWSSWKSQQVLKQYRIQNYPSQFAFGKYQGLTFQAAADPGYTSWYYSEIDADEFPEHKHLIQEFLIEIGELVKWNGELITKKQAEWKKADEEIEQLESGHHFEDGQRVELQLREVSSFSFEAVFGRCYVVTYADGEGRMFKYMGSSPLYIKEFQEETTFVHVRGTVKHDVYEGEKETKLKRMMIDNNYLKEHDDTWVLIEDGTVHTDGLSKPDAEEMLKRYQRTFNGEQGAPYSEYYITKSKHIRA